ncbi:hypothetical protein [Bradyrhizobium sp.]
MSRGELNAAVEGEASPQSEPETWHGVVQRTLKRNDVRLVPYVPDRVLATLIRNDSCAG